MSFPFRLIDLTHTLCASIPSWNGSCGFDHTIKLDYAKETPSFRVQQIKMHAGIGTHLDAPSHCVPGGLDIDGLLLEKLIAPCVVIDLSDKAHALYVVSVEDLTLWENQHGKIEAGVVVVIRTGWERFWNEREKYHNDYKFPSVSGDVARMLVARGVYGLGIDTLSPDRPGSGYPVHEAFLGSGCYLIENLANVGALSPRGSYILSLPIKTLGGSEAPARVIGLVPVKDVKG